MVKNWYYLSYKNVLVKDYTHFMSDKFLSLDDSELIVLCRKGDEKAYSALIARYLFTVRSRASVYENSGIDFEDLMQEGYIGLVNAVKSYESNFGTSFSTFAYMCIDRNILSAVRKSMAKKQIPKSALVFIEDDKELCDKTFQNPETAVISKEMQEKVWQIIDLELSDFERQVLDLYLLGYSYQKIGEKLDCSKKAVDNAIQRIRKKLKQKGL